jgi:hypothetical protein
MSDEDARKLWKERADKPSNRYLLPPAKASIRTRHCAWRMHLSTLRPNLGKSTESSTG